MTELADRHCHPYAKGEPPVTDARAAELLSQLANWRRDPDEPRIAREFRFKDFRETMLFVNAAAWVADREDHHPEMVVGYNRCTVRYSTHSVGGLSENDFICAARLDALIGA